MDDKESGKKLPQHNLKFFLIKLVSISIASVIVINLLYNLIFAEKLNKIDKILSLNESKIRNEMKEKIRNELSDGLNKENIIAEEDKKYLFELRDKRKFDYKTLKNLNQEPYIKKIRV